MERPKYETQVHKPRLLRGVDQTPLRERLINEGYRSAERLAIYSTMAVASLAPLFLKYAVPDQIGQGHPGELAKWGIAAVASHFAYPITAAVGRDIGKKFVRPFRGPGRASLDNCGD
jgi:hypothetical protein